MANTGMPLDDAYLWVKLPGESDGECDSAGGVRAWDYSTYNPWDVPVSGRALSTRCGVRSTPRPGTGLMRRRCS
jgi:hypothetical protein